MLRQANMHPSEQQYDMIHSIDQNREGERQSSQKSVRIFLPSLASYPHHEARPIKHIVSITKRRR